MARKLGRLQEVGSSRLQEHNFSAIGMEVLTITYRSLVQDLEPLFAFEIVSNQCWILGEGRRKMRLTSTLLYEC